MPLFSIIFNERWVPFYIVLLLLAYLWEPKKKVSFQKNKQFLWPFLVMVLVFVFFTLVSSNIALSVKVLERQVSLLLLPLVIFTAYWKQERFAFFLKVFVFTLAAFCLYASINLLLFYVSNAEWIRLMNETQNNNAYLLFKFPHLVDTHPTYWSYLLVIGNTIILGGSFFFLFKRSTCFFIWVLFNATLLLLAARTPIAINIVLHLLLLVVSKNLRRKISVKRLLALILATGLIGFFLLYLSNFLLMKFQDIFGDDRFYLWPIAIERIKANYFILGEGLGLGNSFLKEYIIMHGDVRTNYNYFDLHNQYLRHYLDMGILGFLSFLYLLFYPIFNLRSFLLQPKGFLVLSIVVLFTLACLTEAPLYRLKGIVMFSICYPVFLLVARELLSKRLSKA